MSPADEQEFLAFLKSNGDTVLLPATSSTSEFTPIHTLPGASQDVATRRFWLKNTTSNLPLITELDESRGVYVINGFQSPVAEFLRSFTVSNMMLPGRLQADMAYFDDNKGDLASKPWEFSKWFENIEARIRNNYRHVTLLTYAGPGAEEFRKQGGMLH